MRPTNVKISSVSAVVKAFAPSSEEKGKKLEDIAFSINLFINVAPFRHQELSLNHS